MRNTMTERELMATQFAEFMAKTEIEDDMQGNTPCEYGCRKSAKKVNGIQSGNHFSPKEKVAKCDKIAEASIADCAV